MSSLPLCTQRSCTVKRAALALATLVASTVALGQQTTPPTPAEPRTSTTRQQQTVHISQTDKLTLINDCTRLVLAAHPSVPEKDVKAYCEDKLRSYTSAR